MSRVLTFLSVGITALSVFTAGCSPFVGDANHRSLQKKNPVKPSATSPQTKTASKCTIPVDLGLMDFTLAPIESMTVTFFNKSFDQNRLDPLMNLSFLGTSKFISESGKNLSPASPLQIHVVYSAAKKLCKPATEINLSPAPPDQLNFWKSLSGSDEDHSADLMGVYIPKAKADITSVQNEASMLVVDFASKWVLVHEFMHHLFHSENNKRQREGIGFSDAEIEKQMQETRVTELSKNFDQDKTEANAVILATEYRKFSLLLLEQMRRFPLEEMTIEILLLERVEKKDFKYIQDDVEIKSAANYVLTSFTNYGNLSNQIKRMNLKLSRDLKKVSVPASKMLEKVIDDFLLVDAEAEQLYNRAAEILDRTIPVPDTTVGIVAAKVDNEPIQEKKCSHSNYSLNINVLDLK